MPRLVRGALGRMQRGRWNTTVANAWGVLALDRFSARFEADAGHRDDDRDARRASASRTRGKADDGTTPFATKLAVAAGARGPRARARRHRRAVGDAAEHRGDSAHGAAVERLPHHAQRHAGAAEDHGALEPRRRRARAARGRRAVRHDVGRGRAIRSRPAARCSAAASAAIRRSRRTASAGRAPCGRRSRSARSTASARTTATCRRAASSSSTRCASTIPALRAAADARRGDVRAGDVRRAAERGVGGAAVTLDRSAGCVARIRASRASRSWSRCRARRRRDRGAARRSPTCAPRYVSSEALLVDRHGAPLSRACASTRSVRRLDWVPLADVSPALSSALIAAEDKRFYEHHGVDWQGWRSPRGTASGARSTAGAPRGGSTLTMQLAGCSIPRSPRGGDARTLGAEMGPGAGGAARSSGTWTQGADPRGLPQSRRRIAASCAASRRGARPVRQGARRARRARSRAARRAAARARRAARGRRRSAPAPSPSQASPDAPCERDPRAGVASRSPAAIGMRAALEPGAASRRASCSSVAGERVATTLDADAAARSRSARCATTWPSWPARGVEDGAIVVLDNASGDVLAYVGSSGELSRAARGRRRRRAAAGRLDAEAVPVRAARSTRGC